MAYVIDNASAVLMGLSLKLRDQTRLHRAVATELKNLVKDHFQGLAATNRNPFGVRSSFWRRMRGATRADFTASAAAVVMEREIAQRYYGGVITPKKAKFLAIPISRKSYGKAPRSFKDLKVVKFKSGGLALVRFVKGQEPERMYSLRKSVKQIGNPDVLPTEDQIVESTKKVVKAFLERRQSA